MYTKAIITVVGLSLSLNAGFIEDMASQVGAVMGAMPNSQNSQTQNQNQNQNRNQNQNQNQTQLLSQLIQLLNVDSKQAIGGTTALMALASSKMPRDSYNSVVNSIPGLSTILSNSGASALGTIIGGAGGESGVQTAFKALGMDSSTVSQFAPALLEIFKQYISPENLNLLSQAWSAFLPNK
jgi:hypothetical protein